MEVKGFGPTKVTVWSCENCVYLTYDSVLSFVENGTTTDFCAKIGKKMSDIIPTWTLCPYLKNESTNS